LKKEPGLVKKLIIIISSFILLVLVFTSCSTITGGGTENNEELYKAAIERYYASILQADIDTFLDSIDPMGPMYPTPAEAEEFRTKLNATPGEVTVKELNVLEESANKARVEVDLFMSIDFERDGEFYESTLHATFELALKGGTWRIFNGSME
jgi:predicted small secreted protein